jgi:hypothetical protein
MRLFHRKPKPEPKEILRRTEITIEREWLSLELRTKPTPEPEPQPTAASRTKKPKDQ